MSTGTITVANRRDTPDGINIMRPSVLGNPYRLPEYTRAASVEKYLVWLRAEYTKRGAVYAALNALADRVARGEHITLICCCAPLPCHGDQIKRAVLGIVSARAHDDKHEPVAVASLASLRVIAAPLREPQECLAP
jgi:hypothetical protein